MLLFDSESHWDRISGHDFFRSLPLKQLQHQYLMVADKFALMFSLFRVKSHSDQIPSHEFLSLIRIKKVGWQAQEENKLL